MPPAAVKFARESGREAGLCDHCNRRDDVGRRFSSYNDARTQSVTGRRIVACAYRYSRNAYFGWITWLSRFGVIHDAQFLSASRKYAQVHEDVRRDFTDYQAALCTLGDISSGYVIQMLQKPQWLRLVDFAAGHEVGNGSQPAHPVLPKRLSRDLAPGAMTQLSRLLGLSGDGDLICSQARVLAKQIPLLYCILMANTAALAFNYYEAAPWWLTITLPCMLGVLCAIRLVHWMRSRTHSLTASEARRQLAVTLILSPILGVTFVGWALALFHYGDGDSKGHVAFFIGITVVGCIFCLMHLRPAALIVTASVVGPFSAAFLWSGQTTYVAIAINMILVSIAMVYVLIVYSRDFASMVSFQRELVDKHAELIQLSQENMRLAHTDSLTGLPNRRQFFAHLSAVLKEARSSGRSFAVGVMDLDGFKPVNDVHGHAVGDKLLIEAAQRMQSATNSKLFLARLGGDEFGVIVAGGCSSDDLLALGNRICDALEAPFHMSGAVVRVSGSAGFALFGKDCQTAEALYEHADFALYFAKQKARGRSVIFSDMHKTAILRTRLVEQHLRDADLDQELYLHFQPIVDVRRNRTAGFEALARWRSARLGEVPPSEFIAAAERIDIIDRLTHVLLRKALAEATKWPESIRISFNLSSNSIASPRATLGIAAVICDSGILPSRIDLEVTESALVADYEQAISSLNTLRALGARISLDDFGTGHSSLSHIHQLPIDKIKIDRSFVKDITRGGHALSIVKSVLLLTKNLGCTCIVEGIETDEQAYILRNLDATMLQGFLFSRPLPAERVQDYLRGCTANGTTLVIEGAA